MSGSRNGSAFQYDEWSSTLSRHSGTVDPRLLTTVGTSTHHHSSEPRGSGYGADAGRPSFSFIPWTEDRSHSSSPQMSFREMDWSPSEGRRILDNTGITSPALYSFSVQTRRSSVGDNVLDYGRDSINRSRVGEFAHTRRDALTGSFDAKAPGLLPFVDRSSMDTRTRPNAIIGPSDANAPWKSSSLFRSSMDVQGDMAFLNAHEPRRVSTRARSTAHGSDRFSSRTTFRASSPAQTRRDRSSSRSGSIWRSWVDLDDEEVERERR